MRFEVEQARGSSFIHVRPLNNRAIIDYGVRSTDYGVHPSMSMSYPRSTWMNSLARSNDSITKDPHDSLDASFLLTLGFWSGVVFVTTCWCLWIRPMWEAIPPFSGVPSLPKRHWFFGHGFQLVNKKLDFLSYQHEVYEKHADRNGRTGFWLLQTRGIILTHAKDVLTVLRHESHKTAPRLVLHHLSHLLGPEQLGLLNGPKWKAHRSAILKSFNTNSVRALRVAVHRVAQTAVATLKKRINATKDKCFEFDIEVLMKLIGIDTLGLSALSYNFRCCEKLELHEFAHSFSFVMGDVFRRIEERPFDPSNILYCIPTAANRAFHRHQDRVRSLVQAIVQDHRQRLQDKGNQARDLLDNLLQAHECAKDSKSSGPRQHKREISESTLIDVVLTILFAGYDTVSNTMTYALYLISQHNQVKLNMLQEISQCGIHDPDVLVYTKAVFEESLRLFPPGAVGNFRNLQRPITLPSHEPLVLPTGTLVLLPFWSVHHNPSNFERPNAFLPERWVYRDNRAGTWKERSTHDVNGPTAAADRSHFFGFSAGGRNCPGGKYATQEAVLVLAILISKFDWALADVRHHGVIPERHGPVQRPKGGILMKIRIR